MLEKIEQIKTPEKAADPKVVSTLADIKAIIEAFGSKLINVNFINYGNGKQNIQVAGNGVPTVGGAIMQAMDASIYRLPALRVEHFLIFRVQTRL